MNCTTQAKAMGRLQSGKTPAREHFLSFRMAVMVLLQVIPEVDCIKCEAGALRDSLLLG